MLSYDANRRDKTTCEAGICSEREAVDMQITCCVIYDRFRLDTQSQSRISMANIFPPPSPTASVSFSSIVCCYCPLIGVRFYYIIANWFYMSLQLIKRHYDISYCVILRCESTRQNKLSRHFAQVLAMQACSRHTCTISPDCFYLSSILSHKYRVSYCTWLRL